MCWFWVTILHFSTFVVYILIVVSTLLICLIHVDYISTRTFVYENHKVSKLCSNPQNKHDPEMNFTPKSSYVFTQVMTLKDINVLDVLFTYAYAAIVKVYTDNIYDPKWWSKWFSSHIVSFSRSSRQRQKDQKRLGNLERLIIRKVFP